MDNRVVLGYAPTRRRIFSVEDSESRCSVSPSLHFGSELSCGKAARALNVPTLLWGPAAGHAWGADLYQGSPSRFLR